MDKDASIHHESVLLDLAGSTGYSLRYYFEKTGSSVEGISISEVAIIIARELAAKLAADGRLRYQVSDACRLPFYTETFTYVLGECNFAFIRAREQALSEVSCVLKGEGVLCTSNFYYRRTPSDKMIIDIYSA